MLERLRNVATKRQQLAQFPGEMQNILGTVGGSISRLAEEGETMNVEDLERQIQVEDSFRQRVLLLLTLVFSSPPFCLLLWVDRRNM